MPFILRFLTIFFLFVPAVCATPAATSDTLQITAEVVSARIIDDVRKSFGEKGPDALQSLLRLYADQGRRLDQLSGEILVPGTPEEIAVGNIVLAESGLPLLKFVLDPGQNPRKEEAVIKPAQRFIEPALIFGIALLAGFIQVKIQQANAADLGDPIGDFSAQMRPFLGMGIAGALITWQFDQFRDWWKRNFWDPRAAHWKFDGSFRSLKDGVHRLVWPRGKYAEAVRSILIPGMMTFTASSVAAYPASPVLYDAPSASYFLVFMTLQALSFGAFELGNRVLLRQGYVGLSQYESMRRISSWFNGTAKTLALVNYTAPIGLAIQSIAAGGISLRLQLKQKIADPLYRQLTANKIDASKNPMNSTQRLCARVLERLTFGLRFQRLP